MSAITAVNPGIWMWKGRDPDYGIETIGHVLAYGDGLAVVDPPQTSGGVEDVRALGEVRIVAITGGSHVRGAPDLARSLDVPLVAPPSARPALREVGANADHEIEDGEQEEGWRAIALRAEQDGRVWEETAYYDRHRRLLVVGDFLTERDGDLDLLPPAFYEIDDARFLDAVRAVATLEVDTLCTGHDGVIDTQVGERVRALHRRIEDR